jgi:histidine ammonia-lyase
MIVMLNSLEDFTLPSFAAISRGGSSARLSEAASARIDARRTAFIQLIDAVPTPWIYNVTGKSDGTTLNAQERRTLSRRYIAAGAVLFDTQAQQDPRPPRSATPHLDEFPLQHAMPRPDGLPPRIVRGALFCRLANFIEGHAAVRTDVALAVASMLDAPLPSIPTFGHGAAGEMSLLSHLFGDLIERMSLEEKEALALINGAPFATALLADSLLSAGPLLQEIAATIAGAIDTYPAPLDAYDPILASLWRNPHAAHALALIADARRALDKPAQHAPQPTQAPVSFRAAPRLLARALRTYSSLRLTVEHSLQAVTDNPVVVDGDGPLRALGNGGFFDADAPPLFDELASVYADLTRLLEKLGTRLAEKRTASLTPPAQARLRGLVCALAGYSEDAASSATRTPLPGTDGGGAPQNDLISPVMQAWTKHVATGQILSRSIATLSAVLDTAKGNVATDPHAICTNLLDRMASATAVLADPP